MDPSAPQSPQSRHDPLLWRRSAGGRGGGAGKQKESGFLQRARGGRFAGVWGVAEALTVHVDLLTQLNQLHLGRHVAHRPHAVAEVFAANESVFVLVELFEGVPQLCGAQKVFSS